MPLIAFDSVWVSPWEWSQSDWAGLTFAVVAAGVILGLRQVGEARKLREEQARPFVIIDLVPIANAFFELKVENTGRTLAYNVEFEFVPKLESTQDKMDSRGPISELNLFTKPIQTLAPGKAISVYFDQFADRLESGLPMTYDVKISYSDPAGKRRTEPAVLDLDMYLGTGGITRHDIHDVHQRLKQIADAVNKWTASDGLKVNTRTDRLQRAAEVRAEREARAAEREQTPPAETEARTGEAGDS